MKYQALIRDWFAVYEKIPAHGSTPNNIILGNYNSKEEAELARKKYGYDNENYYVGKIIYNGKI